MLDYRLDEGVAVLRLDDGKANALSPAVIAALEAALDRAEKEARAVLLLGREGRLCAGFDLGVMRSGVEPMRALVTAGAELMLHIALHPLPVAVGCTGHALAAGAILLLAADTCARTIAAPAEVPIGILTALAGAPFFLVVLSRQRSLVGL